MLFYNDEETIVEKIGQIIANELGDSKMALRENAGSENSIIVYTQPSKHLAWPQKDFLFGRIKTTGKTSYVSFSCLCTDLFTRNQIETRRINKNSPFFRVEMAHFLELLDNEPLAHDIFSKILLNLFEVPVFGCCDLYVECSNNKKCIGRDHLHSLGCQYKVNLENGRIFYGDNRNI